MIEYPPELGDRPSVGPSEHELAALRRTILLKRLLIFLVILLIVLASVTALIVLVLVRDTQTDNVPKINDAKNAAEAAQHSAETADKTLRRIESCTTPGKKCFEEAQARTAATVSDLNSVAIIAASCATQIPVEPGVSKVERASLIENCVRVVLVRRAKNANSDD